MWRVVGRFEGEAHPRCMSNRLETRKEAEEIRDRLRNDLKVAGHAYLVRRFKVMGDSTVKRLGVKDDWYE